MMTDEVVRPLVDACLALTLATRERRFDPALVDAVAEALAACELAWSGKDCIPRLAVDVLVDLQPSLLASADRYVGAERQAVIDAAIKLGDDIRAAVTTQMSP
jgi:hypothetical protein